MCEVVEISDDEESTVSLPQIIPKEEEEESFGFDPVPKTDNVASSSVVDLRSSLIAMGFSPYHVDRAIQEHGEADADLLVETLSKYSDVPQPKAEPVDDGLFGRENDAATISLPAGAVLPKSESLDSLDSLFDEDAPKNAYGEGEFSLKEELDCGGGFGDEKIASLLNMNFSLDEAAFALDRLGKDASLDQLMDFIFATRMAKKYEKYANHPHIGDEESKKVFDNEALFGIMEKTLSLLEMGFSEEEISTAFDKCGSEAPLAELADSIFAGPGAGAIPNVDKYSSRYCNSSVQNRSTFSYGKMGGCSSNHPYDPFIVKTEESSSDTYTQVGISELLEKLKGKRPKVEYTDEPIYPKKTNEGFREVSNNFLERMRPEAKRRKSTTSTSNHAPALQSSFAYSVSFEEDVKPNMFSPNPPRSLNTLAAKPPYFLYGNVTRLSDESWVKVSHFLCSIPPEFVSTQSYSALGRVEGYVHNLPTEDRLHIWPKGPMTIEEALPQTRKWWPSWDTRKQLRYINCDTSGISRQCDILGRMLAESKGLLSSEKQKYLVQQCETLNLVWVGNNKLAPIEPEHLERIMGYPLHHTQVAGISPAERFMSLKLSFQTDTLGYHLSVLKRQPFTTGGLVVLSFFTGIGGAEIALHRLGIHLKAVVSVEYCEKKRKIVKQWWENTRQTGELIQIESTHRLSGNKVDDLVKKFGGFDLVVCQNPYAAADSDRLAGLDFSLFAEFVRVLQRVRITMERNK